MNVSVLDVEKEWLERVDWTEERKQVWIKPECVAHYIRSIGLPKPPPSKAIPRADQGSTREESWEQSLPILCSPAVEK